MDLSFVLDFTKDLLPVLSGILGVLGVLNVFKTVNNRLSIWGWIAIGVIGLSSFSGYYLSKKERADSVREKQQLQDKLNGILEDLLKVKQPLGDIKLTYWTVLPDNNSEISRYKKYIKEKIKVRIKDDIFSKQPRINKDLDIVSIDTHGNTTTYHIYNKSKFWPAKKFPNLRGLADTFVINTCINLDAAVSTELIPMVDGSNAADWCASSFLPTDNAIFYDVKTDKVGLMTTMKYRKDLIRSNGLISSSKDILGSQIFFSLPTANSGFIRNHLKTLGAPEEVFLSEKKRGDILSGIEPRAFILDLGNGQAFTISGGYLKNYNDNEYGHFFYLTIPKSEKQLRDLRPKY